MSTGLGASNRGARPEASDRSAGLKAGDKRTRQEARHGGAKLQGLM